MVDRQGFGCLCEMSERAQRTALLKVVVVAVLGELLPMAPTAGRGGTLGVETIRGRMRMPLEAV